MSEPKKRSIVSVRRLRKHFRREDGAVVPAIDDISAG